LLPSKEPPRGPRHPAPYMHTSPRNGSSNEQHKHSHGRPKNNLMPWQYQCYTQCLCRVALTLAETSTATVLVLSTRSPLRRCGLRTLSCQRGWIGQTFSIRYTHSLQRRLPLLLSSLSYEHQITHRHCCCQSGKSPSDTCLADTHCTNSEGL
jgi:hypothetical protein